MRYTVILSSRHLANASCQLVISSSRRVVMSTRRIVLLSRLVVVFTCVHCSSTRRVDRQLDALFLKRGCLDTILSNIATNLAAFEAIDELKERLRVSIEALHMDGVDYLCVPAGVQLDRTQYNFHDELKTNESIATRKRTR